MQRPTKTTKEKIKEFASKNKEGIKEAIALLIYACIAVAFGVINQRLENGVMIMLTLILFDVLINQFYIQRTYYKLKDLEEKIK
jgi:hypothetical protein|nr:MAG TPA: hypothetical protein [Caudoviricetes sp.]